MDPVIPKEGTRVSDDCETYRVRVVARSAAFGKRADIKYTVRGYNINGDKNHTVEQNNLVNSLAPPEMICDAVEVGDPGILFVTSDLPIERRFQLWCGVNNRSEEC